MTYVLLATPLVIAALVVLQRLRVTQQQAFAAGRKQVMDRAQEMAGLDLETLSIPQVAMLCGGARRVICVETFALYQSGKIVLDPTGEIAHVDLKQPANGLQLTLLRLADSQLPGHLPYSAADPEVLPTHFRKITAQLEDSGLAHPSLQPITPDIARWHRRRTWLEVLLAAILLGIIVIFAIPFAREDLWAAVAGASIFGAWSIMLVNLLHRKMGISGISRSRSTLTGRALVQALRLQAARDRRFHPPVDEHFELLRVAIRGPVSSAITEEPVRSLVNTMQERLGSPATKPKNSRDSSPSSPYPIYIDDADDDALVDAVDTDSRWADGNPEGGGDSDGDSSSGADGGGGDGGGD